MKTSRSEMFRDGLTKLISGVALALSLSGKIKATDYYVSTEGDNSRTEQEAQNLSAPWKTIQHAIDSTEGTETNPVNIRIAAGTYLEDIIMDENDGYKSLYGGYNPETWERDTRTNRVIIGGDVIGTRGPNYTFSRLRLRLDNSTIDGFTIIASRKRTPIGKSDPIYCENSNGTLSNNLVIGFGADDDYPDIKDYHYPIPAVYCKNSNIKIINNMLLTQHCALLEDCSGVLENNIISENAPPYNEEYHSNGIFCRGDNSSLVIRGNIILGYRTGIISSRDILVNNTFTRNKQPIGCLPTITNCIIWGNEIDLRKDPKISDYSNITHSNIGNPDFAGENGNICADPLFSTEEFEYDWDWNANVKEEYFRYVDARINHILRKYKLQPHSPCIDIGNPLAPYIPAKDIVGSPRILYGGEDFKPDMGAFEHRINKLKRDTTTGNLKLEWSSLADKTYSVYHSNDLTNWNFLGEIPSMGNATTTYELEKSLKNSSFYRAEEK